MLWLDKFYACLTEFVIQASNTFVNFTLDGREHDAYSPIMVNLAAKKKWLLNFQKRVIIRKYDKCDKPRIS